MEAAPSKIETASAAHLCDSGMIKVLRNALHREDAGGEVSSHEAGFAIRPPARGHGVAAVGGEGDMSAELIDYRQLFKYD